AKASQPSCHVQSGAPIQGCGTSSCSSERVSRTFGRGGLHQCSSSSPRHNAGPKRLAFSVSAIAAFALKEGRRETAAKLSLLKGDISAEQIARRPCVLRAARCHGWQNEE